MKIKEVIQGEFNKLIWAVAGGFIGAIAGIFIVSKSIGITFFFWNIFLFGIFCTLVSILIKLINLKNDSP